MKRFVFVLACLAPFVVMASAAETGVDWQEAVLRATGSGPPDMKAVNPAQARLGAERSAQADALRSLLEQAKAIPVTAGRTVGDALQKEPAAEKALEAVLREYTITAKRYFADSGLEIDVEVPLAAVMQVVLPSVLAPANAAEVPDTGGDVRTTGVVVDARGVKGFEPALLVRLVDDKGQALYEASVLTEEARKRSVVGWAKSPEEAKKKGGRVGARPLIVKAQKANGSDLILNAAEAKKLGAVKRSVLSEGRVVIVTRPAARRK